MAPLVTVHNYILAYLQLLSALRHLCVFIITEYIGLTEYFFQL